MDDGGRLAGVLVALGSVRPLTPDEIARSRGFEERLQIEAVYAGNALDGSTLTLDETARVIATGLAEAGKPLRDQVERLGPFEALAYVDELIATSRALTADRLRHLHALAFRRSRPDIAGRFRTAPATGVTDYSPPDAVFVPESIDGLLADYTARRDDEHPVILAADLHQGIVDIHPFETGNGLTARLAMNFHLMQYGYPLTIVRPEDGDRYADAIRRTRTTGGAHAFRHVLIAAVRDSLDRYRAVL